jgi:hypothetical protein
MRFPVPASPPAEIDHTIPSGHGGTSDPTNLGLLCGRHHALKTNGLWHVEQLDNGCFVWRSHLGITHVVKPEQVDDDDP